METALVIIFSLASVVALILWTKFLTRIRKGKFTFEKLGTNNINMFTDFGTFTINGQEKKLYWKTPKNEMYSYHFMNIKGLAYNYEEKGAFFTEFFFSDFNITDFSTTYEDKNTNYLISLVLFDEKSIIDDRSKKFVLDEDQKIPLFVARQYEIRDFIPILPTVLKALSLHHDAGNYSRGVLNEILWLFEQAGKKVSLLIQ